MKKIEAFHCQRCLEFISKIISCILSQIFIMAVGSNTVAPVGTSTDIRNFNYSDISGNLAELKNSSEIPLLNKSCSLLRRHDINTSNYDNGFVLNSVNNYEALLKSHTTGTDSVRIFRIGADNVTGENRKVVRPPWTELMKNDTLAFIIWDVTNRHAGFDKSDESVEKCLHEFGDRMEMISPYLVSATVRENWYFLRYFINQISKYSYLHDLRGVENFYDKFQDIIEDHRLYHAALKKVIQNMDQEMKLMIYCAQKRLCSCFSSLDVVRYEEQLSSLAQYNFLLKLYLITGYYIDPIIRSILLLTGLILNCTLLTIFAKHKSIIDTCDFMVMNISVNAILILIVYVPMQYIHTYYSSILQRGEFSYNSCFVAVQTALISVSASSLLTLKAQYRIKASGLSNGWQNAFWGLSVWLVSFGVAFLVYILNGYTKNGHVFVPLVYLLLYVLIFPIAMNMLETDVGNIRDNPKGENVIPTKLIAEISKTFWITHIPLFIWLLLEALGGFMFKLISINYVYVEIMFFYVYFSHTFVNAMDVGRGICACRKQWFWRLLSCWYRPDAQKNVIMKDECPYDIAAHTQP